MMTQLRSRQRVVGTEDEEMAASIIQACFRSHLLKISEKLMAHLRQLKLEFDREGIDYTKVC